MQTVDLFKIQPNELILHFGGRGSGVAAATLANTLLATTQALKEITKQIAPEIEIEITVEAFGPGSFRARIVSQFRDKGTLFVRSASHAIITGIMATIFYESAIKKYVNPDQPINVEVTDKMVVVQRGAERIIVPRVTWEATQNLKKPADVDKQVAHVFGSLHADPAVTEFGVVGAMEDRVPLGAIPRAVFESIAAGSRSPDDGPKRYRDEDVSLVVTKIILEKSKRKWEFIWSGIRISAPINDPDFYPKMAAREYVFGQGDVISVRLRFHQKWDDSAQTYINVAYEILKVHDVVRSLRQTRFETT
jgi:hypothetical protein